MRRIALVITFAGLAGPAAAQQQLAAPRVEVGVQLMFAGTTGEFKDHVKDGGGFNFDVVLPLPNARAFALRADGGAIIYGSDTERVCFGGGVGCRIELDLTTTNSIAFVNAGPQLMLPSGRIRPYVNAAVGFSYFNTTSSVDGSNNTNEDFASTTHQSDITFAWAAGGGVLIALTRGRTPVALDISGRYNANGEAEYVTPGGIQDNPDGSITINRTRSEANLYTVQVGVSVGIRPNR
jgi:opacity protein-like surface antigen